MARLFAHESSRLYEDRLIDAGDRLHFQKLLTDVLDRQFSYSLQARPPSTTVRLSDPNVAALGDSDLVANSPISFIMFGDYLRKAVPIEDRVYTEITDGKALNTILDEYLEEYNVVHSKDVRLIFFQDAKRHISRVSRILRQPRGNALLLGVSGTGKQSLTRLACHMSDFYCFELELTKLYGFTEWREDLKRLYRMAGEEKKQTVFLLSDTQIKSDLYLEDINNIFNSGDVPNLWDVEERERIIGAIRQDAHDAGVAEDRDAIYQFFINRVRNHLHIVFSTSPVGDVFRSRCRMFPSLVNCSTIDWFDPWPREALLSVSKRFLEYVELGGEEMRERMAAMCVEIHLSVGEMSKLFYAEMKRRYYTTPTSYLELIHLYTLMLQEKRRELSGNRDKLRGGLMKLSQTNGLVAKMQVFAFSLSACGVRSTSSFNI